MKNKNSYELLQTIHKNSGYEVQNYIKKCNSNIDLSFLVPIYNCEKYICKNLNSLLNQKTKYTYEVILVNDGSTDNTSEILKKYAKSDKRIKLINQDNHGICYTRNVCLANCIGKYIAFVDSDDFIEENFVEEMMNIAYSNDSDYVKCDYNIIKGNYTRPKESFKLNPGIIKIPLDAKILKMNGYLWASVIKRNVLQDIYFAPNSWFEDMITRNIILRKSKKIFYLKRPLYNYIIRKDSATSKEGKKNDLHNIDQLYLFINSTKYCQNINIPNDNTFQYLLIDELGYMLCHRTRKLNKDIRKVVFYAACDFYQENYQKDFNKIYERIFLKRAICSWKFIYILKHIKNLIKN